jgi:ferritin-like metal-binding protein YciE
MSLVLNVEILGEFKKLTSATQGASRQLKGMGDRSKKISRGINRAFAGIGVGLSFAAITKGFKETTKAIQQDTKARDQLRKAIRNNTKATDDQIASIETYIEKTEIASAISDDKLRPAFATLVRVTKDVTKAQDLMAIALDVSAGTGADLETVAKAMGRAIGGSAGALNRLLPGLKNSKTPMEDLAKAFKGANDEAAKNKSWERFEIILGNIQEMIGEALLPILEDFADWFQDAYPKIKEFFKNLKAAFDDPEVKKSFDDLSTAFGKLGNALGRLFGLSKSKGATDMITFLNTFADILTIIADTLTRVIDAIKIAFPLLRIPAITGALTDFAYSQVPPPSPDNGRSNQPRSQGNRTYNINLNGTSITPKQVVDKIREYERQTGNRVIR